MRIGFIGLGIMGGSMALNILRGGLELTVHDLRRDLAFPHLKEGANWADSPRQVAETTDVVFTSLPGPTEVELVALGDNGILAGMNAGKTHIDLSTNSPAVIRNIYDVFLSQGNHVLDAPVSGGPAGAESGKLALWVGGDQTVYERCKSILDLIGDNVFYVGPSGSGSIAKLVHNCAGYAAQCIVTETFTMGVKAGVEPLALWEAVRQGFYGRRGLFDAGLPEHLLPGKFDPPDFALKLARKDVDLALSVGKELDVPMRLSHLALEELTEAVNRGWGERDTRVAMLLQEERAGVEVRSSQEDVERVLRG